MAGGVLPCSRPGGGPCGDPRLACLAAEDSLRRQGLQESPGPVSKTNWWRHALAPLSATMDKITCFPANGDVPNVARSVHCTMMSSDICCHQIGIAVEQLCYRQHFQQYIHLPQLTPRQMPQSMFETGAEPAATVSLLQQCDCNTRVLQTAQRAFR